MHVEGLFTLQEAENSGRRLVAREPDPLTYNPGRRDTIYKCYIQLCNHRGHGLLNKKELRLKNQLHRERCTYSKS
jgi:hypothetical protein